MNIYNKKHLTIDYDEQNQMIVQKWTGFATSEKYREGILASLDLAIREKPSRILVDISEGGVVKSEDTEWMLTETVPMYLKNGMKFQAFVYPKNAFAQISVKTFDEFTDRAFKANFFNNYEAAKEWLLSNK